MKGKIGCIAVLAAMASSAVMAQSTPVDHFTQTQLLGQLQQLKKQASTGEGSAAVRLADYPNHFIMLTYRTRSGSGEQHEQFADIFYVVSGGATLLTGGTLVAPATSGPGELHGSAVIGGTQTILQQGDIVHIPAHTPHQLVLADGQDLLYFVLKVKEK